MKIFQNNPALIKIRQYFTIILLAVFQLSIKLHYYYYTFSWFDLHMKNNLNNDMKME